jgi:hypothetical protein
MEVRIRRLPLPADDEPARHGGHDQGPLEYVTASLSARRTVTIAKIADAMWPSLADLARCPASKLFWFAGLARKLSWQIVAMRA